MTASVVQPEPASPEAASKRSSGNADLFAVFAVSLVQLSYPAEH
jgi:hypothetical protein